VAVTASGCSCDQMQAECPIQTSQITPEESRSENSNMLNTSRNFHDGRRSLVVSALATGPMGLAAAGAGSATDGGFLWVIKIRSAHFLRRGSKAVGPMS
jgi:hypothetical protein